MQFIKKIIRQNYSLNSFIPSFRRIKERYIELPIPILSDILFLVLYGFIVIGLIGPLVSNQMFNLGIELTKTESQSATLSEIIFQESARPMLIKVALLVILMIILIYILYCLFEGFSWWYSCKIASTREQAEFSDYLNVFYKTNFYWYSLAIIYNIIAFAGDFLSGQEQAQSTFMTLAFFIFLYLAAISYSMLPGIYGFANIKKAFSIGIRDIMHVLPAFIIIAVIFLVINLIMYYSIGISNILFLMIGVFMLMPAISWARIYSILVVQAHSKAGK